MGAMATNCLYLLTLTHILQVAYLKEPHHLIYGGYRVNITDAPFMAILKNTDHKSSCGASIIHTKMLLSAAHCKKQGKSVIIVGTNIYTPHIRPLRGQYFAVKEIVTHSGFIGDEKDDICVVILFKKKFKYSALVKPIPMADANLMPKDGELTYIYGFGATETKKRSENLLGLALPYVEKGKCANMWRAEMSSIPKNTICAGGEAGKSGCEGDSGGPLTYKGHLLGVISAGSYGPCAQASRPLLSTHVASVRDFIDNVMKKNPDTQCAFKVRGGAPVDNITDAPFVASFKLEDRRFTCAATIVHEQFLVATAHCLQSVALTNSDLFITAGSNSNDEGREYRVEKIFIHPEFDVDTYDFDLAVIKLEKELATSDRVKKIKMAREMEPKPGTPLRVYGFAEKTDLGYGLLHKLTIPYYDWRSCKNLFAKNTEYVITNQMFCAGEKGKDDTCAGDNGGPVVYNDVLLGITSWGGDSCWGRYPSVFTDIPLFKNYIEDIIKNNSII